MITRTRRGSGDVPFGYRVGAVAPGRMEHMTAATPTRAMVWSAALRKRGFQITGSDSSISPNGTVFTSQEAAWAYVQEVEADAARLHRLWRGRQPSPVEDMKAEDIPRAALYSGPFG